MTYRETASAMRRVADVIDKLVSKTGKDSETGAPKPMLEPDMAAGGAAILCYLRDLVTVANRETYDRGVLLVLLETVCSDAEIFPCGIGTLMWQAEDEEGED